MTVGAGALGWVGLRGQRSAGARRLELDAARHDVRKAHEAVTRRRAEVAVAHAELVRTQSERTTHRATEREVAAARRALQNARQTARSASAALRARRESLRAARATVPHVGTDPAEFPLARVVAAHNAVTRAVDGVRDRSCEAHRLPRDERRAIACDDRVPARAAASAVAATGIGRLPDDSCRLRGLPRCGAAAGAGLRCSGVRGHPPGIRTSGAGFWIGSPRQLGRHRSRGPVERAAGGRMVGRGDDARRCVAVADARTSHEATRILIPQRPARALGVA